MPGLAIVVPDHPQIAEVQDGGGNDPRKEFPSKGAPDAWDVAVVHPDHLVADDLSTPGLAGPAKLHDVHDEDQQGPENRQKDCARNGPVIRTGSVVLEEVGHEHQRCDGDQDNHDGAVQHDVEEITPEAVAETGPAIGVVTPDIGATLGAVYLLTGTRWWWWWHVAHGPIVGHPLNRTPRSLC